MANLMILEPDERLNRNMCRVLEKVGHRCVGARTVAEGEVCLESDERRATILNTRLPWADSLRFLRLLEARGLPVLFIVSDPASEGHLRAMYRSSCDVLVAPFTGLALVNAVNGLLRSANHILTCGNLCMDTVRRSVTLEGEELRLTAQEYELLHALMRSPNTPVSREELLRQAWGYQGMGVTRTVDVHIQRLRRKIGAEQIETVYKTGYRLK